MLEIKSISVENLRGYKKTTLYFSGLLILVGENNEGKSSALKMLEHLFDFDDIFWDGNRQLNISEYNFWYPANDTKHNARRFTVSVKLNDGRYARNFSLKKNDILDLRLAIDSNGYCRLNLGQPKRNEVHDRKASDFLSKLKAHVKVILIPPIRDAGSSTFSIKAMRKVKEKILLKMGHSSQAGAPKEYRLAKEAIENIKNIVMLHQGGLNNSADSPLSSMLRASEVRVEITPQNIYELIEKSMYVYLSTGEHDLNKVLPHEVGNGLQSMIDINLTIELILHAQDTEKTILIIEEPEAFLHPSAQRQFMLFLRRTLIGKVQSAILTTHSPIIVDESCYGEVVLVRNHRHYSPIVVDEERDSINTSLMTTSSSEIFFAKIVIFVEGEGDKAFFNTIFRRMKRSWKISPELSGIVFHPTGGCTFYAPWLKLINSYKSGNDQAVKYFWIMDGDTATKNGERPVVRAARDCSFNLSDVEIKKISDFGDLNWLKDSRNVASVNDVNDILHKMGGNLFSCDFEWALFNETSDETIEIIKGVMSELNISTEGSRVEIARRLGSKIGTGKSSDKVRKQPFIRALIAERLPFDDLPPEIERVVKNILVAGNVAGFYENNVFRKF